MQLGAPVYALAFDPTGHYVLVGGQHKAIQLYRHSPREKLVTEYSAHGYEVLDIDVSEDGRCFVSGGGDRSAILWDVAASRVLRRFTGHLGRVNAVKIVQDDLVLTASYDRTVKVWDKRTVSRFPAQILEEAEDSVEAIDVRLPYIASASADGFVRVYDIRKEMVHCDAVGFDDITTSGNYAAAMQVRIGIDTAYYAAADIQGRIKLVDLAEGTVLQSFAAACPNTDLRVNGMVFDRNEERILYGAADGGLYSWNIVSGEIGNQVVAKSHILCCAFSRKNSLYAVGCLDGTVLVKNANS